MTELWYRRGISPGVFWSLWSVGLVFWAAVLLLLSPYDLELASLAYRPHSDLARVVERWGEIPSWVLVVAASVVTIRFYHQRHRIWFRLFGLSVLGLALLEPLLITQTLKFFCGRVRFRDLAPDLSNYTPFFLPHGPGRGESFPSGHVAMAWVSCAAAYCWQRIAGRLAAVVVWLLVVAYGVVVFWGRIAAGAHYFTDCWFSAGSTLLLGAVLFRLLERKLVRS